MDLNELFTDDDAVSPVIGVILMVAITVILAAVIGAFVLNIGGSQEAAPTTNIQWESNTSLTNTYISATVQSGDPVKTGEVEAKTNQDDLYLNDGSNGLGVKEISAGSTIYIYHSTDTKVKKTAPTSVSGTIDSVDFVWHSQSSDKSSIIASFTA